MKFARYALFATLVAVAINVTSQAQPWPQAKPVKRAIAFGPGSASDIFARMIGEPLQKALGQAVIVQSKPGAGGQIAADYVARRGDFPFVLLVNWHAPKEVEGFVKDQVAVWQRQVGIAGMKPE